MHAGGDSSGTCPQPQTSTCAAADVLLGVPAPAAYDNGGSVVPAFHAGDLNGDGKADLVLSIGSDLDVLLTKADGTFEKDAKYTIDGAGLNIYELAIADFDGDCKPDIVAPGDPGHGSGFLAVLRNKGDGTFEAAKETEIGPHGVLALRVADFNNDGKPDVALQTQDNTASMSTEVIIAIGSGGGAFASAATHFDLGMANFAVGDLNNDGFPDIVGPSGWNVAMEDLVVAISKNGQFSERTPYRSSADHPGDATAIADIDHDGKLDVVMTVANGTILNIYHGNGDGMLGDRDVVEGLPYAGKLTGVVDMNNDGWPDVVFYNSGAMTTLSEFDVFYNDGKGKFSAEGYAKYPAGSPNPYDSRAIGDFGGNGLTGVAAWNMQTSSIDVIAATCKK